MPRKNVRVINPGAFISHPGFYADEAKDLCMPVVVKEIGVVVQEIRVLEIRRFTDTFGGIKATPLIAKDKITPEALRSFVEDAETAYIMAQHGLEYACLISFEAAKLLREKVKPAWASRWTWPEDLAS